MMASTFIWILEKLAKELMYDMLLDFIGNEEPDVEMELEAENSEYNYECLKELDPVAANRIHPNDQRKVSILLNCHLMVRPTNINALKLNIAFLFSLIVLNVG